ncbi:30S ribosomal protein S1 [Candidatus Poribacteria bacterium]|nr:30S ribosomal protein S1 [Candidatus Poribacteria bacterium]
MVERESITEGEQAKPEELVKKQDKPVQEISEEQPSEEKQEVSPKEEPAEVSPEKTEEEVEDETSDNEVTDETVAEQESGEAQSQDESEAQEPSDQKKSSKDEESSDEDADDDIDIDLEDLDLDDLDLNEEEREKLLEAYDETLKDFEEGEIVKGIVVKVDRDEVMVDVGYKSEGYIPVSEFGTLPDGSPNVKVGDPVDVYLLRKEDQDGLVVLSKEIADQKLVWDSIAEAYEKGEVIQGKVTRRIKGGLKVEIGNVKAFLPASQVELRPVQNFDRFIGKTLDMKVIKLSKRRRNIVLSRRVILEEEREKKRQETLSTLEVGQIREGVVKNITQFGAFIDLGGVDGLLHKSDMSWGRVNHPSEVVSVGDKLEVMVLAVDVEAGKISLGVKQKTEDPWLSVEDKYPVGSTITGKVVNIVDYGAFVELEPGVEGLIHVSEMSWTRRIPHPSKLLKKGDVIQARVLDVNVSKQKISLGIKQLQQNPWELLAEKYPVGSKIQGRVRNLTDFGAFVEIEEGIDGLIHVSDLSWAKRVMNPADVLSEGDEVEAVVLSIDPEKQRVSLGLKQVEPDPWLLVPEKYGIGSIVKGTIVNITNFGAFAKLEEGVEGLIHISELDERHVDNPEEIVSVGDEVNLKVISLDTEERRIGLSLKEVKADQQQSEIDQYSDDQTISDSSRPTMGDLIDSVRFETDQDEDEE